MRFLPSKLHHKAKVHTDHSSLPNIFSLLCWNVYKKNKKDPNFTPFLQNLINQKTLHLCLFQEAQLDTDNALLSHCNYDGAANLEINCTFYGVVTASQTTSLSAKAYLSESREGLIGSHKSLLLSTYRLSNGEILLILNVHAINFRENRCYQKELAHLMQKVSTHRGAMIIAGDFNAWNRTRNKALHRLCQELSLKTVIFEKSKVTSFMGYALDFIFYRGLTCLEQEVLTEHHISDHHPLFVKFLSPR